ncbi:hypothetical protein [Actinocorallia herbida]|uniref:hypothetical protein n=1 Tax=Actinocorallia herbida TaxID=58109 RepID=UPI000F4CEB8B|nr:hypothetical protein [Actinocorallia herbida]
MTLPEEQPLPAWKEAPAPFCSPRSLHCTNPECPCPSLCLHTAERHTTNVCITTLRTTAHLRTSPTGTTLYVVRCPHCRAHHTHTTHPNAHPYRRAICGGTYVLDPA